jgi:integral membrane sensor domain MASE1
VEAIVLATGLLVVGLFVFEGEQNLPQPMRILYLPFPLLLWATVRFGAKGVTTAILLVMALAIAGVTEGAGPFVTSSAENTALSIQSFLIVVSIPLLVLAADIEERRRAESAARHNEERLAFALKAAQMDSWE